MKMLKYLLLPPLVLAAGSASVNNYSSSYVGQGIKKNAAKFIAHDYISKIKRPLPPTTTILNYKEK
ncbi:putative lysophospholipase L1 biosynthesis ABC-type transport system permease subunit [Bartonella callosciuri]|uniref:Putative lysophospholipase L1 biosynthesis ABC-type transport system permease subunit n=1 Tax=Bartonella callosciuri TaxID=686223 RepID=A0A840NXW1_9HYPH|nr:putative lysophospholipase L1 biosynthesis ABC-type transport system permease subunit [Bartonella callosciuri]